MKTPLSRLIVTIAAIIVIFWLIGLAFKVAGWLLNLLLPAAALILIIAIIISWYKSQHTVTRDKAKDSLKISRDTSDKKK